MTRALFLGALFKEGYIDLRAIKNAQVEHHGFVSVGHHDLIDQMAKHYDGSNVYIGVAERRTKGDGSVKNCSHLRALFVDLDFKDFAGDEDKARASLAAFPIPPSIIVHSGGGLQCYWPLAEPLHLQNGGAVHAKRILRALARAVGGDLSAAEPARILRLPGTRNHKPEYGEPRDVVIEAFTDRRHTLADLEAVLPITEEDAATQSGMKHLPEQITEGSRNDLLFKEGCHLRQRGHSEPEISALLKAMNAERVQPPLDAQEVERIAGSAVRYEPGGREGTEEEWTEEGDARVFATTYGDRVRFFHRSAAWAMADPASGIWVPDSSEQIIRYTSDLMIDRYRRATNKEARAWAHKGHSRTRITNTYALARSIPPISVPATDTSWDDQPFLLGVPNGVVDLRTGVLRRARPEEQITMRCRVAYDPAATCSLWEDTLRTIFTFDSGGGLLPFEQSPEDRACALVEFMQRAIGYTLTGDVREECFFICWGTGRNGKGTILNLIYWLLGDYASNLSMGTLEEHTFQGAGGAPRPDTAKLPGKRMVTASENRKTATLDEEMIKKVTGRDPVTVRQLYKPEFTFDPVFKLWLMVNNKPEGIREEDVAMWERIHLIPFLRSFENCADTTLKDQLKQEAAGILNWAVRGSLAWQRDGLRPPTIVKAATQQYREESDTLASFIECRCALTPTAASKTGDLLRAYGAWCQEGGQEPTLNHKTFTPALVKRKATNGAALCCTARVADRAVVGCERYARTRGAECQGCLIAEIRHQCQVRRFTVLGAPEPRVPAP